MIAMFLAALAVYLSRMDEEKVFFHVMAAICICISCCIYQAYVSFSLLLAVCYFIDVLMQNNHSKQDCFRWILRQIVMYIVSLTAYYVIWKLCMHFSGAVATDYQGISEVGNMSVGLFINGLVKAIKATIQYFLQWNVLEHGFTLYSILNILFLIIMVLGLLISCIKSDIFKRKWAVVLLGLCLIAVIPFACIWAFTTESVLYRAMMLQSLTLLFVLTALLYERWARVTAKNVVCLFLILVVFNNALMANISYFYMNLCYERTYAEGVEMMTEIHDFQDEYEFDKIAVVGTRIDDVKQENIDPETGKMQISGKIPILSTKVERTLLFDSDHTTRYLQATFGFELESLNMTQRNNLLNTDEVKSMGCWPAGDSITVIDDTLVIKLSDKEEGN